MGGREGQVSRRGGVRGEVRFSGRERGREGHQFFHKGVREGNRFSAGSTFQAPDST